MESHSAAELEKLHVQLRTLQVAEEDARHRGDQVSSLQEELEAVRQELEKSKQVSRRNTSYNLHIYSCMMKVW